MQPAIDKPAPTAIAAKALGSLDSKIYSSSSFRFTPCFPIEETKDEIASLIGITPPAAIEIEMKKAMTAMIIPNTEIITNLFFFKAMSLSSPGSISSFILPKALLKTLRVLIIHESELSSN